MEKENFREIVEKFVFDELEKHDFGRDNCELDFRTKIIIIYNSIYSSLFSLYPDMIKDEEQDIIGVFEIINMNNDEYSEFIFDIYLDIFINLISVAQNKQIVLKDNNDEAFDSLIFENNVLKSIVIDDDKFCLLIFLLRTYALKNEVSLLEINEVTKKVG